MYIIAERSDTLKSHSNMALHEKNETKTYLKSTLNAIKVFFFFLIWDDGTGHTNFVFLHEIMDRPT